MKDIQKSITVIADKFLHALNIPIDNMNQNMTIGNTLFFGYTRTNKVMLYSNTVVFEMTKSISYVFSYKGFEEIIILSSCQYFIKKVTMTLIKR